MSWLFAKSPKAGSLYQYVSHVQEFPVPGSNASHLADCGAFIMNRTRYDWNVIYVDLLRSLVTDKLRWELVLESSAVMVNNGDSITPVVTSHLTVHRVHDFRTNSFFDPNITTLRNYSAVMVKGVTGSNLRFCRHHRIHKMRKIGWSRLYDCPSCFHHRRKHSLRSLQ